MKEDELEIDDARNVVIDGDAKEYRGEILDYRVMPYEEVLKILNEIKSLSNRLQPERTDIIKEIGLFNKWNELEIDKLNAQLKTARADTIKSMIELICNAPHFELISSAIVEFILNTCKPLLEQDKSEEKNERKMD